MPINGCADPVLLEMPDSCGCAITKCTITTVTPAMMDATDWVETGLDKVYATAKENRMVGVQENSLVDLFRSRLKPKPRAAFGQNGSSSLIAPWFLEPSPGVINANYFQIVSGGAGGNANQWDLVVSRSASKWATEIPHLERYFIIGNYVAVHYVDAGGTARRINAKVISSSVNVANAALSRANVRIEANESVAGFNALSPANKAIHQPTHGAVQLLQNSVSDRESYCYNKPSNLATKWRDGWWQTFRNTSCVNDEYLKALSDPLLSDYFRKFRSLPMAQRRKQEQALSENMEVNTYLWGEKINEFQTVETFTSLPQVFDPVDPDCCLEYKANAIGIFPQLATCLRLRDAGGGPLDVDEILVYLEDLARYRGLATGQNIVRIEAMTDSGTLANLRYKMLAFLKAKYGYDNVNLYYTPGQKFVYDLTGRVLWNYEIFTFLDIGLELAVMSDFAFDDHIRAFPTADKNAARYFAILDWSDIDIYLAKTRSVNRQTNVADDIYNCVIDPVVTRYQLESKTVAPFIHDPNRHIVWTNFSTDCPIITATPCSEYSY
jgi:hypothetical protein